MTDTIDAALELTNAYKDLHPAVLTDLKIICHPDQSSMLPGSDALTTAFREGQRSIWLHIAKYLNLQDWQLRQDMQRREIQNYRKGQI